MRRCPLLMFVRISRRLFATVASSLAPKDARSRLPGPARGLATLRTQRLAASINAICKGPAWRRGGPPTSRCPDRQEPGLSRQFFHHRHYRSQPEQR